MQENWVKDSSRKKLRLEEEGKRTKTHEALNLVDGYLQEHAQDEWLIQGLAGVEEQFGILLTRQKEIAQKGADQEAASKALELAANSLDTCQKESAFRKQELVEASKQIKQGKDVLSQLLGKRLLREYRTEKETLLREMAFLAKIVELEEHRARLEDGKPCPLCGATEHPFAEGNIPVPDETEERIDALTKLICNAEDQEVAIRKLEDLERLAHKNFIDAEKLESSTANDKKVAEKTLAEIKDAVVKLHADSTEFRQAVFIKLRPLGIVDDFEVDISLVLESLRKRLNVWQLQVKKKVDLEKQVTDIDGEVVRLDAVIEMQCTVQKENQDRLESLRNELLVGSDERNSLYGEKNPSDEERSLNTAISVAENAEKQARERHNKFQQEWNMVKSHTDSLRKRIDEREPNLSKMETEFSEALTSVGFTNEEEFQVAMLPSGRRNELADKAKNLDERQTDLKARQNDREKRLSTEMSRQVTEKSKEELEPQLREFEASLSKLREIIAGNKHKLSENAAAKGRINEKRAAIEIQKIECSRWENLQELIGSADGKKYRNFAQGLTFEMMIGHANRELQKMTDRYLLVRDHTRPLELNVVDSYQAGEIRSTKNLSGGESFIVSLSLALGLSHMASKNVRVDSLFLDEGFGTLDEEALDTALETLSSLQQDGKLIGVISHVSALKERISTQIQVTPQTGGRSNISGPGCYRLEPL
ncbi:SbcC/MukB-like Walker B domain-containing protein [Microbulbifer sp. PSTR4-B]|uniref:SbcC/MukB-like Walker B domain-containing protein n=1 Tax=Microbulbifer sp. PSTR4-B TaxID=3243396 RepID=UPI00403A674C